MNGHPRHPLAEELAEFRAGVTDGARTERLTSHLAGCPDCVSASERLAEISALLAALPPPSMPPEVETMITGALAAEAARRESAAGCPVASPLPVSSAAAPASSVLPRVIPASPPARVSPEGVSQRHRRSPVTMTLGALGAVAACLLLAFAGLRLTGTGQPSPASPPTASGGGHAKPGVPALTGPGMHSDNLSPGRPFSVLVSAADFQRATLREQILHQFPAAVSAGPSGRPVAGGGAWISPSRALVECVARITGHASPAFVEAAMYQSRPVYVIAVPARAWVVARDCTPADPAVLTSVELSPSR